MLLNWLRDWINNSQFETHLMKGDFNYTDYYSKHNAAMYHKQMCPKHLVSQATTCHRKVG